MSKVVYLRCCGLWGYQCMEDMVRQSHSSAKQFIISNVTQLVERRQVAGSTRGAAHDPAQN